MSSPSILTGKTVVDVGCGRGGGSIFISQTLKAFKVYGVDYS